MSALSHLFGQAEFADRHIGPDADDLARICEALGVADIDSLIAEVVPESIRLEKPLDLPGPISEVQALARLADLAQANVRRTSLIGTGYSGTVTPPVLQRNILENPAWYTAYTPYQPEISQGRLEALLNFQTMVSDLTGLAMANASLLDEGTAAAEAMTMCRRLSRHGGQTFLVDAACHPQTIAVIETRAEAIGLPVTVADPFSDVDWSSTFAVLVQNPGTHGQIRDLRPLIADAHAGGALVVVAADILSLVLLEAPGHLGADIVVGSTQRFGVPMGFGGPHAAFMAAPEASARSMPGRIVGVSHDANGRNALRLALQTREQHIRREKATSNICTAQVLLAVMAGMYALWHGPDGLRRIALRVHRLAQICAAGLRSAGVTIVHDTFFDTITAHVAGQAESVVAKAALAGIDLRLIDADTVSISFDETATTSVLEQVWSAFAVSADLAAIDRQLELPEQSPALGDTVRDPSQLLTHPVFHRYRSEHEMLRYLRRLADFDLALDRTMIPLGSCTMKLNATSEMAPITW
ncbi:MAG: glycine dehydrogenase (aminomethyl-transferring), partial [Acidimicrobiia bacterium]